MGWDIILDRQNPKLLGKNDFYHTIFKNYVTVAEVFYVKKGNDKRKMTV